MEVYCLMQFIGASLSEPHTSRVNGDFVYVCMYVNYLNKRKLKVKLKTFLPPKTQTVDKREEHL